MSTYTVVASYYDPPSMFCGGPIEAASPAEAIEAAWLDCCDGNGWIPEETARTDEWSDVLVLAGAPEVVG